MILPRAEYKILLIDEVEDDYLYIHTLLEGAEQVRFHLTWVKQIQEGIAILEQLEHDVCLVNSQFNGIETGFDLLARAKKLNWPIPLVLLTNDNDRDLDRQAIALGASDCLCKDNLLTSRLLERSILHALERQRSALELREMTEQLMLAKSCAQLGIWEFDLRQDYFFFDDRTCELYGLDPQSSRVNRTAWEACLHPQDLATVQQQMQQAFEHQEPLHTEFRIVLAHGRTRYLESHGVIVTDQKQRSQRMIGVNLDISDHKETEAKLQYMNWTLEQRVLERTESLKSLNALLKKQTESFYNMNQLLNLVINSIPQGIFWKNRQSVFLGGNQRFADDVGIPLDQLKGKENTDLKVTPEEAELYTKCDQEVMETGQSMSHFLEILRRPDHSEVYVDITKVPLRNQSDQIIGILGCYEDVSDRKRAEWERQKLLQELSAFKTAIDRSASIAVTDENGVILEANDQFCTLSGYSRSELVGHPHSVIKSGIHPPEFYQDLWKTIRNGEVWQGEICNRSKTGQLYWEESSIVPFIDAQGNPTRYLAIRYDISSRKAAEQAIQRRAEQEKLLREISQSINQSLDLNAIFELACQHILSLLECDRVCIFEFDPESEFQQGNFVAEAFRSDLDPLIKSVIKSTCFGDSKITDYTLGKAIVFNDLENHQFSTCLTDFFDRFQIRSGLIFPLHCNEKLWGLLCLYQSISRHWQGSEVDFTQQLANQLSIAVQQANLLDQLRHELQDRQAVQQQLAERNEQLGIYNEELLRATRLKDEFLASMSHELRTPLNAILGMSEVLQEDILGAVNTEQRDALQIIQRSGSHLLELINDILDVAKIESGQLELHRTPVSLSHLCQSSVALVQYQATQKDIAIHQDLPESLPQLLLDERRIRQVLVNLLNNAVKFTAAGGSVSLRVSLSPDEGDLHRLEFAVEDTGIGIAPEYFPQLFQPFVQIDSALNRQYSGTGLGLAVVKRVVELHAGTVDVTSEVGVGSCFTITIPCQGTDYVPPPPSPIVDLPTVQLFWGHSSQSSPHHKPCILLAEDNATNVNTLKIYFEAQGYQLCFARNGAEAIVVAQSQHPDLILMDIQMPEVNGLEAIQILRRDPDFEQLPIIALTALTMPGDRERCLEAGATDYLSKPIQLKELERCMQQYLQGASPECFPESSPEA
jgi:PAS domain S-box-containing protein